MTDKTENSPSASFAVPVPVYQATPASGLTADTTILKESTSTKSKSPTLTKRHIDAPTLQGVLTRITNMERKLETIELIVTQNKELMRAIGEVGVLQKQIVKQESAPDEMLTKFPVKNKMDLLQLEKEIEGNEDYYVAILKNLLRPDGIQKNLNKFFGKEIAANFNYDGIRGKKALKTCKNLCGAIFKALSNHGCCEASFTKEFKHALKIYKNQIFKKACVARKKATVS